MEKKELLLRAYESIFESSPESIAVLDSKGNIIDVNIALEKWSGYKKSEMLGKNIIQMPYLTQKSRLVAAKQLAKRLIGQKIKPYELDFIDRTGNKKIGRIIATLLKDDQNKIFADLVMISDVTELKDKMAELERMNKMMVDRELQMIEMKKKIEELQKK